MYTRAVIIAGSILLATGSTSAFAADIYAPSAGGLKDPVLQEEVILPEAETFQENAEWFIRGDVGFGAYSDMTGSGDAVGTPFAVEGLDFENFFSGSIGFGRYVTPNVRLGLDVDYRHKASSTFITGDPAGVAELTNMGTIPLELTTTAVMLSAIYDFAPNRRISPYIGGGIGWAFHELDLRGTAYFNDIDRNGVIEEGTITTHSTSSNSFAANVVTGVSFNVRKGLFLDVGYKFSYLGDADVNFDYSHPGVLPDPDPTIDLEDMMTHEFKVGLRYDLY